MNLKKRTSIFMPLCCLALLSTMPTACSVDAIPSDVGQRSIPIIGGTSDTEDKFVVGISIRTSGFQGTCTGSLISPNLVLTARHCVSMTDEVFDCQTAAGKAKNKIRSNFPSTAFTVTTANYLFSSPKWKVKAVRYVSDAECVLDKSNPACTLCDADLALLELEPDSTSGFPKQWVPPSLVPPEKGSGYEAIGFGCQKTEAECTEATMNYRMKITGVRPIEITENTFTVRGRVCSGDSGGPIFDRTGQVVFGALSRGDASCLLGVFTRGDAHLEWLQKYGKLAADHALSLGLAQPDWVTAQKPVPPVQDGGFVNLKKGLGEPCTMSKECQSGSCMASGDLWLCTQSCSATEPCPEAFECVAGSNVCWPAPPPPEPPPAEPDAGQPPPAATPTSSSKGCSVASDSSDGQTSSNGLFLVGFGIFGCILMRRRTHHS